jgi:hypothetical protein
MKVRFFGGPLHGTKGKATRLPYAQVFTNSVRRIVFIYYRDELVFRYSHKHSQRLTENYDSVREWMANDPNGRGIPFVGDENEQV